MEAKIEELLKSAEQTQKEIDQSRTSNGETKETKP